MTWKPSYQESRYVLQALHALEQPLISSQVCCLAPRFLLHDCESCKYMPPAVMVCLKSSASLPTRARKSHESPRRPYLRMMRDARSAAIGPGFDPRDQHDQLLRPMACRAPSCTLALLLPAAKDAKVYEGQSRVSGS